jgi:hypothetical protein
MGKKSSRMRDPENYKKRLSRLQAVSLSLGFPKAPESTMTASAKGKAPVADEILIEISTS